MSELSTAAIKEHIAQLKRSQESLERAWELKREAHRTEVAAYERKLFQRSPEYRHRNKATK